MSAVRLPSLDVPDGEKARFSEADVHSKLFEPDMVALGYPARTNTQADGAYFLEQRHLAMRRLKSRRERGHYDGLYLIGNSPLVLCELKRFEAIDAEGEFERAVRQLQDYARSEDFEAPPPFLLLYCGKRERTRFYRLREMADASRDDQAAYEEQPEIWTWERVKAAHLKGEFAEEVVDRDRLLEILLHHLDQIEDDLRAPVTHAVEIVGATASPPLLNPFGEWLMAHDEARTRVAQLYQRKVAELGGGNRRRVAEEMVTQAALNYLNKVFFLNLCEDRNLPGFYRIMREFLPESRSETTATEAAVFLGLLRRKIRDTAGAWRTEDERAYRSLRGDLAPEIGARVIERNHWWDLIRVAFDLAGERFPLVYREDAFDYFSTRTETLAELVYDLSTKSFAALSNRHVGDIYQGLLSSRRTGTAGGGARRRQQAKLGAFYTPEGDVSYMVSRLNLQRGSRVLDPCMGSGHFLAGLLEELKRLYLAEGFDEEAAFREVVGSQIYGGDIDTFATSLAAIRMFLLDEHSTRTAPNLYVHDMLLHTPERPASELFSAEALEERGDAEDAAPGAIRVTDQDVDAVMDVDETEFDAVVGNPPYGAKKPVYKQDIYRGLYGQTEQARRSGSRGTGDADTYAMFIASGIERLREGGRLCFITNDSFRSLTTHAALRRFILDRCKIVEILLTDTKHFEGVSFQFAGMSIMTLEKCSDTAVRAANEMRLVDYVRDPADFPDPPPEKVSILRQEEYEALPETPFFVGIPREVFEGARDSERVHDVARGRQGLITADDNRFLAGIDEVFSGLDRMVSSDEIADEISDAERTHGIAPTKPCWVPFAKGEGFGEYWKPPSVAIDWSRESVEELLRRDALPAGTSRKPRFQNRDFYFRPGITYSVVSSGRLSARLMPEGWIFSDKGSAIFTEDQDTSELFLLGFLNSALATYFMKRIVNTTATAHIGYIEKLPYRRPTPETERAVVQQVERIITALKEDPEADIQTWRDEIDERIFDLFEIRVARDEVRRFYETVGRAERTGEEVEEVVAQAASE